MHRKVMIDGVIYTDHEMTELNAFINEFTVAKVDSTGEGVSITRYPTIQFEDGMTVERAEELVFALPEYAEYIEPTDILDQVLAILTDEQAEQVPGAFHEWAVDVEYKPGDRIRYGGKLYKCLTLHTSQEGWEPGKAPSLWAAIGEPGTIPEWSQPDSTNPYMKGDKVTHNGKTWESLVDNNVWEPGAAGTETLWTEVS